ncbi:cytochrome P450 [Tricladium varicosporioides]|nr:cytochrome P450 [Hymenoscyphus varicosporioides]
MSLETHYSRIGIQTLQRLPFAVTSLAIPIVFLLLWRFIRFTVLPILHPNAPKELPHWFPGHTWSFFKDPVKLVERGINFTNRSREPFSLPILGRTFYVITDPRDVTAVYKARTVLSFTSFLNEALHAFGVNDSSLKLAWHTPSPGDACYRDSNPVNPMQKPFIDWIKEIYRQQLLPGEKMNIMADRFRQYSDRRLQWKSISLFDLKPFENKDSVHLSLKEFTRTVILEAITDSLFGTCLTKVEPSLIKYVEEFNDDAWMLVHRYPKRFAGKAYANRKRILDAFNKYRQLSQEERTAGGESWAVKSLITEQNILGMSNESNSAFLMLIHWAADSNASWLCFWLLSYLVWDKQLLERIHREITPAFQSGHLDVAYLLSSCPLLDSCFFETLRLGGGTVSVRTVMSPITVGGKDLQTGNDVLILHRSLHFNENVWGDSYASFEPERFLKDKKLSSNPAYIPFGGGNTYCPGRVIIRQKLYIFLALLLDRMDIELAPDQKFPLLDDTQPSIGVAGPRPDMDLYVTVRERKSSRAHCGN